MRPKSYVFMPVRSVNSVHVAVYFHMSVSNRVDAFRDLGLR